MFKHFVYKYFFASFKFNMSNPVLNFELNIVTMLSSDLHDICNVPETFLILLPIHFEDFETNHF